MPWRVDGQALLRAIRYAIERKLTEQALRQAHDELEKRVAERTARLAQSEAQAKEAWQEAERANKAKDQFLAVLSHELRTPLTAMLGWVRLLQAGRLDAAATTRGLQVIERNVQAQAHIIEDLLDVSRIVAGKLRLEKTIVDVAALTRVALEALRPIAQEKHISLNVELGESCLPFEGDTARLQQVVWNLVSNALKFTPVGGKVDVSLAVVPGSAGVSPALAAGTAALPEAAAQASALILKVRDTGRGIKPEFIPRLFTRFTQEDSSTSRSYTGLGLGLAIVHHIVKLHGGTIQVESAGIGQGATFCVTLPLTDMALPVAAPPAGGPTGRAAALQGRKILFVEDDPDVREVLAEALRVTGATLELAGTAAEALTVFKRFQPDVVVSDIGLPGEDGYALMRGIRAWEKASGAKAAPAIAVTGYAQVEDHTRAHEAGYQEHLAKPVEPDALIAMISAVAGN